jgi:hypothetical protein
VDFYSLFEQDDPKEQAALLGAALRGQQGVGSVLAAHPLLAQLGQQMQARGDKSQAMLAEAGQQKYGSRLQQLMQERQQKFTSGENSKNRAADMERLKMELGLKEAMERLRQEADAKKNAMKAGDDLRGEFNKLPQTQRMVLMNEAATQIQNASPDGAGDLALVYGLQNMIDPGSIVREQDFVTVGKSGGLPGVVQGYFNQLTAQGFLHEDVRKQIKKEAAKIYNSRSQAFEPTKSFYSGRAQSYGLNPDEVLLPVGRQSKPSGGGLSADEAAEFEALQRKYGGQK